MAGNKNYSLEIEAGTDFARTFLIRKNDASGNPTVIVPLTGTGYAQVRTAAGAKLLVDFAVTIDGANGSITIRASRTSTRHRGTGVWDCRIVNGAEERVYLRGSVNFLPQVAVTP